MSKKIRIPKKKRYCLEKLVKFDKKFGLENWETRLRSDNLNALFPLLVDGYRIWDSEDKVEIKRPE